MKRRMKEDSVEPVSSMPPNKKQRLNDQSNQVITPTTLQQHVLEQCSPQAIKARKATVSATIRQALGEREDINIPRDIITEIIEYQAQAQAQVN